MQEGWDGRVESCVSEEVTEPRVEVEEAVATDHTLQWIPINRRLISALLGLNVTLFGAAMVVGEVFKPAGHQQQNPEVFVMVLMGLSLVWMLWYLLWARKQPGPPPHTDNHAGSAAIMVVLMLFAALSLLLCVFWMGYYLLLRECQPLAKVLSPFIQTPFFTLQAYLLWAHSKDCIHKHKVLTRCGFMAIMCADGLLWFCAVTDDSVHLEIELEWQKDDSTNGTLSTQAPGGWDDAGCRCDGDTLCVAFQKGYEILYPFNMEFSLLAACLFYVMWKNVGRHVGRHAGRHVSGRTEHTWKTLMRSVWSREVRAGYLLGLLVLLGGVTMFVLYHLWVDQKATRLTALLLFYCFHLGLLPTMALCSLSGTLLKRKGGRERGGEQAGSHWGGGQTGGCQGRVPRLEEEEGRSRNPTQSLDVALLLGTALGQLALSYLTLVAALALGPSGILGSLDLSYSLLSLVELVLQNIFIIKALHLQPHGNTHKLVYSGGHLHTQFSPNAKEAPQESSAFPKQTDNEVSAAKKQELEDKTDISSTPTGTKQYNSVHLKRRAFKEICAFLILSNITLWMISAFGAHPELKSSVGKQFFGFSVWFVLVNLSQPLTVFYRMHSVGALIELLTTA